MDCHLLSEEDGVQIAGIIWTKDGCLIFREDMTVYVWNNSQQTFKKVDNAEQMIGWPNSNANVSFKVYPTSMSQNPMTLMGSSNHSNNNNINNNVGINNNNISVSGKSSTFVMQGLDGLVIGATDGNIYWIGKSNRVERNSNAHNGVVLVLRWSPDGNSLVSAGEDGVIKVWSRSGMLRSTINATVGSAEHLVVLAWSPRSDRIVHASNDHIMIKTLTTSTNAASTTNKLWKAHDATILALDWAKDKIVSGGEDYRVKIWDEYGRCLFASSPGTSLMDISSPVTRVAWSNDGKKVAVGTFDQLCLMDSDGYYLKTISLANFGSVHKVSWKNKELALCGGRGTMAVVHITNDQSYWKHLECSMVDERKIKVYDLELGVPEILDLRDIICDFSVQYGYLQVQTTSQLHIYLDRHWNTPAIIDLPANFIGITKHDKYICVVDRVLGIQIYATNDAKLVTTIKQGFMASASSDQIEMDLGGEVLAIRNGDNRTSITFYDIFTGKSLGVSATFSQEIIKVRLDNSSHVPSSQRLLAYLDVQGNLYVSTVFSSFSSNANLDSWRLVASNVRDFIWHETHPLLVYINEQSINVCYNPAVHYNDPELKDLIKMEKSLLALGKSFYLTYACGQTVVLSKENNALIYVSIPPYITVLYDLVRKDVNWEAAVKLARYINQRELWAVLATLAIQYQELNSAEVAYAALDELAKVQFICHIKQMTDSISRQAELALFRHAYREAESIFLTNSRPNDAIELALRAFRYDRASAIAKKFGIDPSAIEREREADLKRMGIVQKISAAGPESIDTNEPEMRESSSVDFIPS